MSEHRDLLEAEEPLLRDVDENVAFIPDGFGPTMLLARQIDLREDLLGKPVVRAGSAKGVEVWGDEHRASGVGQDLSFTQFRNNAQLGFLRTLLR